MNVLKHILGAAAVAACLVIPSSMRGEAGLAGSALPDSPGATLSSTSGSSLADFAGFIAAPQATGAGPVHTTEVSRFKRTVQPGQTAPDLTAADKLRMGIMANVSLSNVGGSLFSASWGHLVDSRPHVGVDLPGFGERFGYSLLKGATQNISRDGIYSNIFREDPHYYVRGRGTPILRRAVYAASRTFIVRKDNGSTGIYYSNLAGIATANALTNLYYPHRDRGAGPTFSAIGSNILSNMGTNELREFLDDALRIVFHKKK